MKRGANVSLTREIPNLVSVVLGISFSAGSEAVLTDNLVVAAILCNAAGKALSDDDFVFFNQLNSPDLSVTQLEQVMGPDKDQIEIDLNNVPENVSRIVVVLYVNEGAAQRRTLGQLRDLSIRVLNLAGNAELVRSENLATGLAQETALALGEMYRYNGEWKFKVIGSGYSNGIVGVANDYGLTL
jgi:tellurium resistance protein TerD